MQDLNDLFYFVQVVDHGGFAPAGRALGVQKSKLSRRVLLLEDRLGVRLLNRSSRRFSITEIGREYYDRCAAMLVEADAAEQVVAQMRAEPRGVIRLSCPTALLASQGFDIAIRVRFPPLAPSDLVMRQLDQSTQCLVASPALVAQALTSPADLAGLPSLDLGPPHREHVWQLHHGDGRMVAVRHAPRLVTDDMQALREAAHAGIGVVQLPIMMVWEDLAAGSLVDLLPDWRPPAGIIHATFASRRGLLPSVRALLDFLVRECAAQRTLADRSLSRPASEPTKLGGSAAGEMA